MTFFKNTPIQSRLGLLTAILALAVFVLPFTFASEAQGADTQATAKPRANNAATQANKAARANKANANKANAARAAARAKRQQAQPIVVAPEVSDADSPEQKLLANSPFMSKAFKERLAKSEGNRARDLIFRGFAGTDQGWLINVYNNQEKLSQWVRVGETVGDITISEFDIANLRIKITKDSTSIYLPLE